MNDYTPLRIRSSFFQRRSSFLLFLLAMALLGFLTQFQWVGYLILLGYIVVSCIKHFAAKVTFIAGLLTLAMVVVSILLGNWLVAQNFAAYTFILLIFGVVVTVLELKRPPRRSK